MKIKDLSFCFKEQPVVTPVNHFTNLLKNGLIVDLLYNNFNILVKHNQQKTELKKVKHNLFPNLLFTLKM